MVDISSVVEGRQKDAEYAHCSNRDAYSGDDPVYRRIASPPKDKYPNRHQGRFDAGKCKSPFWTAVDFDRVMLRSPFLLVNAKYCRKNASDANGSEYRPGLFQIKAMIDLEYQRNRPKLKVENSPGESNPQAEEEDHGLSKEHMDWSIQGHSYHPAER